MAVQTSEHSIGLTTMSTFKQRLFMAENCTQVFEKLKILHMMHIVILVYDKQF